MALDRPAFGQLPTPVRLNRVGQHQQLSRHRPTPRSAVRGRCILAVVSQDSGGGGAAGGSGSSGDDNGRSGGDDQSGDGFDYSNGPLAFVFSIMGSAAKTPGTLLKNLSSLPGPYIAFMSAIITTLLNQLFKFKADAQSALKAAADKLSEGRAKKAGVLREFFERYSVMVLHSAGELSERLYTLGNGGYRSFNPDADSGALYTTYLLARFLGAVVLLHQEHPTMNFGRPSADRLFSNLMRRITGVLEDDSARVAKLAHVLEGIDPASKHDLTEFRIPQGQQHAVGELMRQSRWNGERFGIGEASSGGTGIYDKVLSWPDFVELYRSHPSFRRHMTPILDSVTTVGTMCAKAKEGSQIPSTRLALLQTTLVELVDFLDPQASYFYTHRRRRLYGPLDMALEMPENMKRLYASTARLMAGDVNAVASLGNSQGSEVRLYVTGPKGEPPSHSLAAKPGSCPFTQRVIWYLMETGIPFKKTTVSGGTSRPSWYLNLHSEGIVPVIEHRDTIVEDSVDIIEYLAEHFPDAAGTLPSCNLPPNATHRTLARFRRTYYSWLQGRMGSRHNYRHDLDGDLERLNTALQERPDAESGPFFGGTRACTSDMALLPHLQRLSVAGQLKEYSIPKKFTAVHDYLEAGLRNPYFARTLPSDEAILDGYKELLKHN